MVTTPDPNDRWTSTDKAALVILLVAAAYLALQIAASLIFGI